MPPERSTNRYASESIEQRSDSNGGLLLPALGFIIGTAVGWLAYVFAALVVLNYLVRLDAIITIAGLSPSTTFWVAVGVLVVIAFVLFGWPGTVLGGWLLMAGVVATVATYGVGWTETIVIVEGLTLAFIGVAAFVKMVSMLPTWAVFYLDFDRRRRR